MSLAVLILFILLSAFYLAMPLCVSQIRMITWEFQWY